MPQLTETIATQIKAQMGNYHPRTAIILGSGLGALAEQIVEPIIIPYGSIEGFPHSTVKGHTGALIIGRLDGVEVLCLQGRFHLYEGHSPAVIKTVIQSLKQVGIRNLVVTNAAGSLKPELAPGSLMLINDHINFSGQNPLVGTNEESEGPRFPDMSNAYDFKWRQRIMQLAEELEIPLSEGTYLMVMGPNFETAAEIRAFQIWGASAVGMSTVPEVIAAIHAGIKVLGISVITNYGTGMQPQSQSHSETLNQAGRAAHNLTRLVKTFVREIN